MGYVEETQKLFGEQMRYYRKQRRLTLLDMAKRLGTTVSSMSRIEHGKQNLSMAYIVTIAEVLDVSVQALFGGDVLSLTPSLAPFAVQYQETLTRLEGLTRDMAQLRAAFTPPPIEIPPPQKGAKSYSSQKYGTLYQKDHAFASKWHFV